MKAKFSYFRNVKLMLSAVDKNLIFFLLFCLGSLIVVGCYEVNDPEPVFSAAEKEMIVSADSTTALRVLTISDRADSIILRTPSDSVRRTEDEEVLRHFVHRLYHTVTDSASLGVGIAAPQVGILKNIIWVQRFDKEQLPFEVYINPEIVQYSDKKQDCREGCLSIPNRTDTLSSRSYAILLQYEDLEGKWHVEMVEGFTAVIFQHEIDHLDGILYTDHLEEEKRSARRREAVEE
jgi:peptide deformylase